MNIKNKRGFNTLMIVVAVAATVVVGLIVWHLLDSNNQTTEQSASNTDTPNQQTEPALQTDPNEGYVVIKEWGVRFKLIEGLSGVEYSTSGDSILFSTAALKKFGTPCSTNADSLRPLGQLTRTTTATQEFTSESGAFAKKINDYYYRYTTPQTACSEDAAARSLQTQTAEIFKKSVITLEAAK